jgi:pantetheine-phosphate adenylyltransferase
MKIAIFPGSFDPFTAGHLDVLNSALKIFDKVIIAVGYNMLKKGFFPHETRVQIIKDSIIDLVDAGANIEVCSFTGLTVDLCRKYGAHFVVRGLRTTTDFELESVISQANKKMFPEIVSVFIPASGEYSFISSTVVRDVIINGGDPKLFMPKNIDINKYILSK